MPDNLTEHAIAVDLARVFDDTGKDRKLIATLAWGDKVHVQEPFGDGFVKIRLNTFNDAGEHIELEHRSGFIMGDADELLMSPEDNRVLKMDFIDVQQGDGAVLETASGKVMLIDGGDNQLFARYLAARYGGTTAEEPKTVDCILVTHGDADHFLGLTEIEKSEGHKTSTKRLFLHPKRVYHNGIVKLPGKDPETGKKRPDEEMLGPTTKENGRLYLTGLVDDLIGLETEMNEPFTKWRDVLRKYKKRGGAIACKRIQKGDNAKFRFLSANEPLPIRVEVLGPIVENVGGENALPMLRTPSKAPRDATDSMNVAAPRKGKYSASHTINGHSIVLRIDYGRFSFLLAGDLNEEAERTLTRSHQAGELSLKADVFKVPHHGSADFSAAFISAVSPAVSVVSSGDERARKEFIHPRANLVGALGKYSSIAEPLIFITELAAFFEVVGYVNPAPDPGAAGKKKQLPSRFFAFRRSAFGIVKIRTDGERLFVHTDSGQTKLKESYAFVRTAEGALIPSKVTRA